MEIQLERLQHRLAERHLQLRLTDAAKELLIEAGYNPVYGARPLRRTIQQKMLDPLALSVLAGEFHEGDVVVADVAGDNIVFRTLERVEVAA